MAKPQVEDGYIRIANEIWDAILSHDFTKRQRSILDLVLRVSYGCGRKYGHIPQLRYFSACGVAKNHIAKELASLCDANVLTWDRETMLFGLNKDYEQWGIRATHDDATDMVRALVAINLGSVPKTGTEVPEKGTGELPKQEPEFPKQEPNTSSVPETGTVRFPKQEPTQGQNPLYEGDEAPRKDSIKDINPSSRGAGAREEAAAGLDIDEGFVAACQSYQQHINQGGGNAAAIEKYLDDGFEPAALCAIFEWAGDRKERNLIEGDPWRYTAGTLNKLRAAGLFTLADWESDQASRLRIPDAPMRGNSREPPPPTMTGKRRRALERSVTGGS